MLFFFVIDETKTEGQEERILYKCGVALLAQQRYRGREHSRPSHDTQSPPLVTPSTQ